MNTKSFDRTLYDKCDPKGKAAAIKLMAHFGYTVKDDTEAYKDRDIILTKDGNDIWVEAECSPSWKCKHWVSYWDMTCPTRKKESKAKLYIRTNSDTSTAIVVPMKTVHNSPIITKNTIYTKNESFYNVNIDECDIFDLSNIDKTKSRYILS